MTAKEMFTKRVMDHEGLRLTVYDDATGLPIDKGTVVKGYPTIGYGRCVTAKRGITRAEAEQLLSNDIALVMSRTLERFSWVWSLDEVRQSVVYEMAFQIGLEGLAAFRKFLTALSRGRYEEASVEMLDSKWAREDSPKRALELAEIIRTGVDRG